MTPMTAERMTALREQLAGAADADERLPVLAEMIDLAADLTQAAEPGQAAGDEDGSDEAASAAVILAEALAGLHNLQDQTGPAPDPENHAFTLYLTAQACLLRDGDADLDEAIACLRELRDWLTTEPPDEMPDPGEVTEPSEGEPADEDAADFGEIMTEVEIKLGQALFQRMTRSGGVDVVDLAEASAALRAALDWMPSDAPARPPLTMALAWQYALRYIGYGGTQDHRMAGLALAAEGLTAPGVTGDEAASCHMIMAWLSLLRHMTAEQRSTMLAQQEMEAARRGDAAAAADVIAVLGDVRIDPADAQTALDHLSQVPDDAELAADLRAFVPSMAGLAHLALMRDGQAGEGIGRVAGQLQDIAREEPLGLVERGEMLALRAALLSAQAQGDGRQAELGPATAALQDAAGDLPAGHPMRGPLVDLMGRALRQQVDLADAAGDFAVGVEPVLAMLEQIPPDDPQFARALTSAMVYLVSATPSHRAAVPFDRLLHQLDRLVARLPPDDPVRQVGEAMRWGVAGTKAAVEHQPDQVKDATAQLEQRAAELPADSVVRPLFFIGAIAGLIDRYTMTGQLKLLEKARQQLKRAEEAIETAAERGHPGDSAVLDPMRGQLAYLRSIIDLAYAQTESSGRDLAPTVADMEQAAELTKTLPALRSRMLADLETVRALRELRAPARGPAVSLGQPERDAFAKILTEVAGMNRDHVDFPTLAAQAAGGLMMRGIADRDKSAMGQGIALLAEACSVPDLTLRERPRMLSSHGFALLTRYDLSRDARDLSLAIDRLEEARRAVEQELGSPYAASVLQNLAYAYRLRGNAARGDVDRAVTVGLDALRERAGDVLLQDDDASALMAARRVTSDASEMARWFLAHGRPDATVEALEYGRGTVLHAATSGWRLTEALEEVDRADLAAEWAAYLAAGEAADELGDGKAADDLRYRVMIALEGSAAEASLLAPPSLADITAALRASHADMLVYLLPHGDDGPGMAVLVDADGTVRPLLLQRLRTGPGTPVGSFLEARRAAEAAAMALLAARERKAGEAELRVAEDKRQAADGPWRAALGELCDWAWDVATGPLLDAIPARSRGSRRVVLVPAGELGLVAWHAARQRIAGGGYRYAAQEAVFTYAASARQFTGTASQPPRSWAEQPVLISDADDSLQMTARGISYLHEAYYPQASVFGYARTVSAQLPNDPEAEAATAEDVLAALPHGDRAGASVLHFGCHGSAGVPVLSSRLNLGEGREVAVGRILKQARRRSGQAPGGLVVLASCLTDVAEDDYDEAVTVATAFLTAGATGVVAARWAVPESATALFMVAFHHYLNAGGQHPAQALRSAQIWMLDPGREPLRPLPAMLRDEISEPGLADPVAWAGFAYQGW